LRSAARAAALRDPPHSLLVRLLFVGDARLAMDIAPPCARVTVAPYEAWAALPPAPTTIEIEDGLMRAIRRL
jgi:hypothetical protein